MSAGAPPTINEFTVAFASRNIGQEMHRLIADLYPLCRSITGNGFRETLSIIRRYVSLRAHEVPTGTKVFDWTVPKEWKIRDAYIANSRGKRIIDFNKSNLHVVGYSVPVKRKMALSELREHLFTVPEHPDWIPWRTSYYKEDWGLCLSHRQLSKLTDDEYEVCIDASLEDGHLTYGEYQLQGESSDEVVISCHACHPSLCNDNLSGVALVALLAKYLTPLSLRYSYRFLFLPVTIGSITWLALNESQVPRIKHGLAVACVGDPGRPTYKKSRRGNADIDKAVGHILKHSEEQHEIMEFSPYGYDERQFCSPGFDVPMGCLMRTPYGRFPEYHTSADNLDFIQPQYLGGSFSTVWSALYVLEHNRLYVNQNPKCEPQLGRRGLYRAIGGQAHADTNELAMLWVLNLSDGRHTLLDIAQRSGLGFRLVKHAADRLLHHGLLKEQPVPTGLD